MAGLLSRFTNFVPNTTILSNDHNQELNRIVNLLNGTTTNLKTVLKTSDAGDPPLELDQLSTGPIQEWYQGGVLKASITNAGNYKFAASGGFIADENGNEYLKFFTTASAVNFIQVFNSATGVEPAVVAEGDNANISLKVLPKGTGVVKIQSGAPVAGEDAANKTYVDGKKVAFAVVFPIADPTVPTVGAAITGTSPFISPEGTNMTVTKLQVMFKSGSHTAGGSVSFDIFKRNSAGGGGTSLGTVTLDNTNNTVFVLYTNNIGDVVIGQGDSFDMFVSARSGTVTERDVSVVMIGTQQVF